VLESIQGRKLNIDGFNAAGTYHYEYMHLPCSFAGAAFTVAGHRAGDLLRHRHNLWNSRALPFGGKSGLRRNLAGSHVIGAYFPMSIINCVNNPKVHVIIRTGGTTSRSRRRYVSSRLSL